MKILFISMPSVHAIRWIENLKDTSFELFWYDITNRGTLDTIASLKQFSGLNKRKLPPIKGEYKLSKKFPKLYETVRPYLEITENEALEKIINDIHPDVIHSFEMQTCSYPILKTMNKFPQIKWIYSCWGSDLFYFMNLKQHHKRIRKVLKRVDFLHTDCHRDFLLAETLGFTGQFVGVIPGGAGFKLQELATFRMPVSARKIILVKGYQHKFGRALRVVQALQQMENAISAYEVVVFGAHQSVIDYIKNNELPFMSYGRHDLSHHQMMDLMGKSLLYIGNSTSDGLPNTLLEAIVMGAFPIQSNPGNVTAEVIANGENGFLIDNPEDVEEIQQCIVQSLANQDLLNRSSIYNYKLAGERLAYNDIKLRVQNIYNTIAHADRV